MMEAVTLGYCYKTSRSSPPLGLGGSLNQSSASSLTSLYPTPQQKLLLSRVMYPDFILVP